MLMTTLAQTNPPPPPQCQKCSLLLSPSHASFSNKTLMLCSEHDHSPVASSPPQQQHTTTSSFPFQMKQFGERAKRSLKSVLPPTTGGRLFGGGGGGGGGRGTNTPPEKKKPLPIEVGVPAEILVEKIDERLDQPVTPVKQAAPAASPVPEFETIVEDGIDTVASMASPRAGGNAFSSPLASITSRTSESAVDHPLASLRRASTAASTTQSLTGFSVQYSVADGGPAGVSFVQYSSPSSLNSTSQYVENKLEPITMIPDDEGLHVLPQPQYSVAGSVAASTGPDELDDRNSIIGNAPEDVQLQPIPSEEDASDASSSDGDNARLHRNSTSGGAIDPLNILTAAVARELEILPQAQPVPSSSNSADLDNEEIPPEERPQPWVYPPAHAGVSPMLISVVDPDRLWTFVEAPLMDRMAFSKVGGARRAKFTPSDALKPQGTSATFSRYRHPYLHVYLCRCETVQDYAATIRPRLKAFKQDVERREDPEWLLVLVESSAESKSKVLEKLKVDFSKERVVSVSVCDDKRGGGVISIKNMRPAGDGQWGDLAQRLGTCIVRAFENRRQLYRKAMDAETVRDVEFNFLSYFTASESLAFASLQVDRFDEAFDIYADLQNRLTQGTRSKDALVQKLIRCGMMDSSGSSIHRPTCSHLLFPPVPAITASTEQDAFRAQVHRTFPARIFDVERLPFRDLIGSSTVSGIQLQLYLFARVVLNLLCLGRAREAVETSFQYLVTLRGHLKRAYPQNLTVVDAWMVSAGLEIVAAGHACAAVFANEVDPADRVGMCLSQAAVLDRARSAMEDISRRELGGCNNLIPELAVSSMQTPNAFTGHKSSLPVGLARAFFGSPEAFRAMYGRLLEAGAAHFVAAGRFRCAANLTHRRALLLQVDATKRPDALVLFEDAGRWWSGEVRTVVFGTGAADTGTQFHDDWPCLRIETCLALSRFDKLDSARDVLALRPRSRRDALIAGICEEFERRAGGVAASATGLPFVLPLEIVLDIRKPPIEGTAWEVSCKLNWTLHELQAGFGHKAEKIVVGFRDTAATAPTTATAPIELVLSRVTELAFSAFYSMTDALDASSSTKVPPGTYEPTMAFVWFKGKKCQAVSIRMVHSSVVVVKEQPFPLEWMLKAPKLLAVGVNFSKKDGQKDHITKYQRFRLSGSELMEAARKFDGADLIITLSCMSGFAFVPASEEVEAEGEQTEEKRELSVDGTSLTIIKPYKGSFDVEFSLVCLKYDGASNGVSASERALKKPNENLDANGMVIPADEELGKGTSLISVSADIPSFSQKSETKMFNFVFGRPISVSHQARFSQDSAILSIKIAANSSTPCRVSIVNCAVVNMGMLDMRWTCPVEARDRMPMECTKKPVFVPFFLKALGGWVPERVGGKTLMFLSAQVRIRFLEDDSECAMQWTVPVVVRRARVVRTRWPIKEGETLMLSPGIEAIRVASEFSDDDEDTVLIGATIDDGGDEDE